MAEERDRPEVVRARDERARARPRRPNALDGSAHFRAIGLPDTLDGYRGGSGVLGQMALRAGVEVPEPTGNNVSRRGADDVPAYIYRDLWVVDCPAVDEEGNKCGDTSFVFLEQPLYMCPTCFNEDIGGKWRRVVVPEVGQRQLIEDVLAHRPLPRQRNWNPNEELNELIEQNKEHRHTFPTPGTEGRPLPPPVDNVEGGRGRE